MQSHSPMFSPAKSPLGPPPGLGGGSGPFMSLDAGSGSVSQQLDAYQERLHAQLQIQQQLLQRQHQLHQMYLFQQQQQQLLGVNPSMMDQHQLPPFFAMAPPGQNSSDTVHPQQYAHPPGFLQGGAPHLMLNRDNGASSLSGSVSQEQQEQAQHIQRHLNDVLFENQNGGGNQQGTATQATAAVAQAEVMGVLPKNHLSLEEIEAAQFMALQAHQHQHQHQQQKPRKSLSDLVLPPEVSSSSERISASTDENAESGDTRVPDQAPVSATPKASTTLNPAEGMGAGPATRAGAKGGGNHRYSHLPDQHHHHQQHHRRKASVTHDTSFSIKDTNLFSVPKYDPYRPSHTVFDTITTEMKSLCEELLPNPAEETRKLGLLDRLQVLANEVFGEADVLPFGSSGNGLALANADMDLCVFLPEQSKKNTIYKRGRNKETDSSSQDQKDAIEEEKEKDEGEKEEEKDKTPEVQQKQSKEGEEDSGEKEEEEEGEEEVSAAEFVERMGNRLEEDPEFRDILQLRKARVPIVKLVHSPTGIACDIGYENHLALWNTRLLRAYSRIDGRLRELVSVIKYWAKQRKLNNPYVGTLSSYAYVLLVIHVLQVWGVLPNLQRITADNSGRIPFWDCQGFNRYFFEDVSALDSHWKPTEESRRQSVGELLYEFFRYFVNEFRYATQVVSIRKGGLLTKEQKEWSKEVDHNVARTVDRYTLFAIRGEFMRATKILSRGGDNIIGRLCQEKEESPAPESGGNSGNTQEDAAGATGEGDGDKGEQEDDLASGHTTTKPARPHNLFSEGDEPIRTNNGNNTSAHGGSGHAGRDSHHGGSRRASMTPRDGHHHSNSRLSYQQQARQQQQQQHGSNQSQRDSYKRASLAGGSHGSNPRDRPRQ
ncbi:hypothetical protein BGZ73_003773 [Actinomortierella ambigua]|nr:hypothetical protein BGZ73_003773 [Actinomortierella ambigua]